MVVLVSIVLSWWVRCVELWLVVALLLMLVGLLVFVLALIRTG